MKIQYNLTLNKSHPNSCGISLPVFQCGDFTQMRGKDALDDHVTTAWQAKVYDGMKWFGKVQLSVLQTGVKINSCINTKSN